MNYIAHKKQSLKEHCNKNASKSGCEGCKKVLKFSCNFNFWKIRIFFSLVVGKENPKA